MAIDWFGSAGPEDDVSMSFRAFEQFRTAVASVLDIDLSKMRGHGGNRHWSSVTADPVLILFREDGDRGRFSYQECRVLADRLRELMAAHPACQPEVEWFANEFAACASMGEGVAWSS